jgi:hypothetical protein
VGRDSLIGPGLKDMDAGLFRNVAFRGEQVFQFRAEVTNVMNWVNLSNPNHLGTSRAGSAGHHHLSRRYPARYPVGRTVDLLTVVVLSLGRRASNCPPVPSYTERLEDVVS